MYVHHTKYKDPYKIPVHRSPSHTLTAQLTGKIRIFYGVGPNMSFESSANGRVTISNYNGENDTVQILKFRSAITQIQKGGTVTFISC